MLGRGWVAERIERAREHRRRQGHALSPLGEGLVAVMAAADPAHPPRSADELARIKDALAEKGRWSSSEERRIMTWSTREIVQTHRDGVAHFDVSVECDGQRFTCACPSVEGAHAYMRLYQALLVEQFYAVGPPWAAGRPEGP
jgi:hypothetical protein